MSSFWVIEGIGMEVSNLYQHLDAKKVAKVLHKQLPDDEELSEIVKKGNYSQINLNPKIYDNDKVNLIDYVHDFFNGMGDLLTFCDDSDVLTYSSDDEGGEYLYYPPSMPWQMLDNEPRSLTEVHILIINAVQKLTNLSITEIEELIDDDLQVVCSC